MAAEPAGGPARRRLTLLAVVLANVLAVIDYNIVSVALPDILRSFPGTTLPQVSWVMNGYTVLFTAALLPAGGLVDRFGPVRLFLAGVGVFAAGSLLCALAPGLWWLVAARAVQAAGGGVLVTGSIALGLAAVPDRRARLFGLLGAASGVATAAGPAAGGVLLAVGGWHWIFLVNVPLAVLVVGCGWAGVRPARRSPAERGLPDVLGAAALAGSLASLSLVLVQGSRWGWTAPMSLGTGLAVLVLGTVGLGSARQHPRPAVRLALLRAGPTAVGNAALVVLGVVQFTLVLAVTLLLTGLWHYPAARAGLALTPGPLAAAVTSWLGGRLVGRLGPRPVAVGGCLLAVASWSWFALRVGSQPAYLTGLLPALVLGFGGVTVAGIAVNTVAVSAIPAERLGTGSALTMLSRSTGAAVGVAGLSAVLAVASPVGFRVAGFGVSACLLAVLGLMAFVPPGARGGVRSEPVSPPVSAT